MTFNFAPSALGIWVESCDLGRWPRLLHCAPLALKLRRMKASYDFSSGVKNPYINRVRGPKSMGRIVASVRIDNASDLSKGLRCDALVDTGASLMAPRTTSSPAAAE
jgi:hypothetical protein